MCSAARFRIRRIGSSEAEAGRKWDSKYFWGKIMANIKCVLFTGLLAFLLSISGCSGTDTGDSAAGSSLLPGDTIERLSPSDRLRGSPTVD